MSERERGRVREREREGEIWTQARCAFYFEKVSSLSYIIPCCVKPLSFYYAVQNKTLYIRRFKSTNSLFMERIHWRSWYGIKQKLRNLSHLNNAIQRSKWYSYILKGYNVAIALNETITLTSIIRHPLFRLLVQNSSQQFDAGEWFNSTYILEWKLL